MERRNRATDGMVECIQYCYTIIPIVKKLAGPSPRLFVADNEIVIAPLAFTL